MNKKAILYIVIGILTILFAVVSIVFIVVKNSDNKPSDKEVTVYFVRHGKTDANEAGLLAGSRTDAHLIEEGIKGAEKTGEYLSDVVFDRAYASELIRTQDTAKIILSKNKNKTPSITIIPLINDISWGKVEGLTHEKAHSLYPQFSDDYCLGKLDDDSFISPIGATSKNEAVRNFDKAMTMIVDDMPNGATALVVGHSSFIWFLNKHFPNQVPEDSVLPNTSVTILKYSHGNWALMQYAVTL